MPTLFSFEKVGQLITTYWYYFVCGAINTVIISILVVIFGFILAFLLALMKMSKILPLRWFANAYIEVFRGTPMSVQILIAFVLIQVPAPFVQIGLYSIDISVLIPGLIAVSMNSAAYVAEVIRSGIQSVSIGQKEAAYSLGVNPKLTMLHIIMPQALRNILPAIGNELVTIIKDSSLLSTIGVYELLHNTEVVRANTFMPLEPLFICAIIYFILTFTTSLVVRNIEKNMAKGKR